MKKINLLKGIALSVSALMVFSLSGCDYISKILNGGNNSNISGGDDTSEPKLTVSQTEVTLGVGDEVQLTATSSDGSAVSWSSLDPTVATVVDGLVKGIKAGETIIWAETDSLMATCNITVTPAPTKPDPSVEETLELSHENLSLELGASATLTATCSVEGVTVNWYSSNSTVATVSNGTVTAKAVGSTTVTASVDLPTGGTVTAYCSVTVTDPTGLNKPGYALVWNDEFNGTSLDTENWGYQTGIQDRYGTAYGPEGWGNDELQTYTEDSVKVSGGSLVITASKLQQQRDGKDYKSGRILTRDKISWTYGYFEAKMQTPTGNGMWPAFWMLPQPSSGNSLSNKYGGWPYSGEIDIMEAKGRLYNKVDNTLHFGPYADGAWGSHYISNNKYADGYTLSSDTDKWHTYALEWTANYIKWFVDDKETMSVSCDEWYTRSPAATSASAPFDQPFYILFDLAVGGQYDNYTKPADSFTSASMYVDYVRVYKKL